MIESPIYFGSPASAVVLNGPLHFPVVSDGSSTLTAATTTGSGAVLTEHGLMHDQTVQFFDPMGLPSGLSPNMKYYCTPLDQSTFSISLTQGGSAINVDADDGNMFARIAEGYIPVTNVDGLWDQSVRFQSIDLPGRSGSRSGDAFYSGKTLVISGTIKAANLWTLRNLQVGLQQTFDDMLPYPLSFSLFTGPPVGDQPPSKTGLAITGRKNQAIDMSVVVPSQIGPFVHQNSFVLQLFADDPNIYYAGTTDVFVAY